MNLVAALSVLALVSAVVLVFSAPTRVPAIVAIVASAVLVLLAFRKMTLGLPHLSPTRLAAAVLLVAAGWAYFRSATKPSISAATAAALAGAALVLQGLHLSSPIL